MKKTAGGKDVLTQTGIWAAGGYVLAMLGIFPLFFHNNYIDIQHSKELFFRIASLIFIAVGLAVSVCVRFRIFRGKKEGRKEPADEAASAAQDILLSPAFRKSGIFAGILAVSVILSSILCQWPEYVISGEMGRQMGTRSYLLCILVFLLLAVWYRPSKVVRRVLTGFGFLVTIPAILQFWGLDPLRMYVNLAENQYSFFFGTVGNINVTAGFLCLLSALLIAGFLSAEHKGEKQILAVLAVLVMYEGFAASSDSFLLGMAGIFITLIFLLFDEPEMAKDAGSAFLLFYLSACLMRLSLWIGDVCGITAPMMEAYPESGLLAAALSGHVLAAVGVIALSCIICGRFVPIRRRKKAASDDLPSSGAAARQAQDARWKKYRKIRNIIYLSAVTVALAVLIVIAAASVTELKLQQSAAASGVNTQFPQWVKTFAIPDSFASNRGYIWKRTLYEYLQLPLHKKLFGCGPDCFLMQMAPAYADEMTILYGAPFADAHCEFLQILMTLGMTGVIGYFGVLVSVGGMTAKRIRSDHALPAAPLVTAAWLFQGLVNNPVVSVTPLVFVLTGIFIRLLTLTDPAQ